MAEYGMRWSISAGGKPRLLELLDKVTNLKKQKMKSTLIWINLGFCKNM